MKADQMMIKSFSDKRNLLLKCGPGKNIRAERKKKDIENLTAAIAEFGIDPRKYKAVEVRDCGEVMADPDGKGVGWYFLTIFVLKKINWFDLRKCLPVNRVLEGVFEADTKFRRRLL